MGSSRSRLELLIAREGRSSGRETIATSSHIETAESPCQGAAVSGMRMGFPARCFVRPYSLFASTYDAAVGIPFFLSIRKVFETLVRRYGIGFRSAADVGCGTGLFACYLSRYWGVPVFAVDLSPEMLRVAMRNCRHPKVCFLKQDMRCLRLPSPVDLVTANFDTLNHIIRGADVRRIFRRIHENLRPGGHLFFDVVTPRHPRYCPLAYVRRFRGAGWEMVHLIRWNPSRRLLSVMVVHRWRGRRRPTIEIHRERAHSPLELGRWLLDAGFVIRGVHDAATLQLATGCPARIVVVARK